MASATRSSGKDLRHLSKLRKDEVLPDTVSSLKKKDPKPPPFSSCESAQSFYNLLDDITSDDEERDDAGTVSASKNPCIKEEDVASDVESDRDEVGSFSDIKIMQEDGMEEVRSSCTMHKETSLLCHIHHQERVVNLDPDAINRLNEHEYERLKSLVKLKSNQVSQALSLIEIPPYMGPCPYNMKNCIQIPCHKKVTTRGRQKIKKRKAAHASRKASMSPKPTLRNVCKIRKKSLAKKDSHLRSRKRRPATSAVAPEATLSK